MTPTPARRLLVELVSHRARGSNFEDAWAAALTLALAGEQGEQDRDWRCALEGTRDHWQSAYVGRPPRRPERALSLVAEDRELRDLDARLCEQCGAAMAFHRGRGRAPKFCCARCRRQFYYHLERARAAA